MDSFLQQCRTHLTKRDFDLVQKVLNGEECSHPFVKAYNLFDSMLKLELADMRSRKMELGDSVYRNDGPKEIRISEAVRQALGQDNVLEAEFMLMSLRWKFIDELAAMRTFTIEALLAYALKLKLLQRKSLFTREGGNAEFRRLFSNIQAEIENKEWS